MQRGVIVWEQYQGNGRKREECDGNGLKKEGNE